METPLLPEEVVFGVADGDDDDTIEDATDDSAEDATVAKVLEIAPITELTPEVAALTSRESGIMPFKAS